MILDQIALHLVQLPLFIPHDKYQVIENGTVVACYAMLITPNNAKTAVSDHWLPSQFFLATPNLLHRCTSGRYQQLRSGLTHSLLTVRSPKLKPLLPFLLWNHLFGVAALFVVSDKLSYHCCCFVSGGAAGGGYSQVIPMEEVCNPQHQIILPCYFTFLVHSTGTKGAPFYVEG